MLESIDCMHWEWKNCPVSWQGQYGRDNSPLFDDVLDDLALVVSYVVNRVEYHNEYYLADGIYPEWASFVKSFTVATDPKHTYFKQRQESARKDVERAFGVLQGRWGLIQQPARAYEVNTLRRIMGFYENKDVNGVIWSYDKGSGVGVGVMLMWRWLVDLTLRVRYPLDLCEIRIKGRRHIDVETHWRDLQLEVCREIQVVEVVGPKSTGSIQSRFRSRIEGLRFLVTQRKLEVKQLEKTKTDCLVKEHETVHLGIKVEVDIMIIRVPGQAGVEDNAVEKKESKRGLRKANLDIY
nr:hypothetical protein [Tanacetum cinerariifolium]